MLGRWVAEYSKDTDSQIFIATHNANFLSGILSSDTRVSIYRLNRTGDNTVFNLIESEATLQLAKSPLLSSQPVLESVFYKGVVVCEADSDRCLYQAVATIEFSNPEVLFIHGHNKHMIKDVVTLLRNANIRVCTIVDMDVLNSEEVFEKLLESFYDNVPGNLLLAQKSFFAAVESKSEAEVLQALLVEVAAFQNALSAKQHSSLSGARGALTRIQKGISKWSQVKKQTYQKGIEKIRGY